MAREPRGPTRDVVRRRLLDLEGTVLEADPDRTWPFEREVSHNLILAAMDPDRVARTVINALGRIPVETASGATLTTGSGPGNAVIEVTFGEAGQTWEILGVLYMYVCDGTVATRTAGPLRSSSPLPRIGAGSVPPSDVEIPEDTALTLTASETGSFIGQPNTNIIVNDAGVITIVATPIPRYYSLTAGVIDFNAPAATSGVAGDTHGISVLARRVT